MSSWSRSGARRASPARPRSARAPGSWALAIERARDAWAAVGGAGICDGCGCVGAVVGGLIRGAHTGEPHDGRAILSDVAAAAVLSTALGLWADTAAQLADDGEG